MSNGPSARARKYFANPKLAHLTDSEKAYCYLRDNAPTRRPVRKRVVRRQQPKRCEVRKKRKPSFVW